MLTTSRQKFFVILILGALTTISPFAIDMYLPAFAKIASDLNTTVPKVTLSVSSYFIGMALGQIFYGPLLDRYGRKKPLYIGLGIFVLASIGCMKSHNIVMLIIFRFVQAMGGCVAQVAAMAMVRDFFPVKESAKVFSLLMLVIGTSPLFAPTVGSFITAYLGWQWVFIVLSVVAVLVLVAAQFYLPEGHLPDPSISLKLKPILKVFGSVLENRQFTTYTFSGAFSFAGLFVYVAGSPIIFMDVFHVTPKIYGAIFAILSVGFIGASQVNIILLKKYDNRLIYRRALMAQAVIVTIFMAGTALGWFGLVATVIMLFAYLASAGISNPNSAALAMEPFENNAGSASALFGFLEIGISAFVSAGVGILNSGSLLPVVSLFVITSYIGLGLLIAGERRQKQTIQI